MNGVSTSDLSEVNDHLAMTSPTALNREDPPGKREYGKNTRIHGISPLEISFLYVYPK
jgi:hypothetical protein